LNIKAYLQISRPANVITAISDILAGVAIASFSMPISDLSSLGIFLLCLSTVGLYAGGIVFNDIFDFELDKIERPERVIPSGKISLQNAQFFGIGLLIVGNLSSFLQSPTSGGIALFITLSALIYDKYGKHHSWLGPINMGLCRGGNLLLGMSIFAPTLLDWAWLGVIPVCYIAAITMISRGEVHGGSKSTLYFAALLYISVSFSQLYVAIKLHNHLYTIPFILLHILLIFKPLIIAIKKPIGPNIGKAVKAGVLSLTVMNAAWASVSGNFALALLVLLLLPISIKLAKLFAVT
jgi:4-hydroxybenzoate polyprenyltransferase